MMYISADVVEGLLLRLPLKSLGRFKSVSKEWKSILESKRFVELHQKPRKILTVHNCDCGVSPRLLPESRFEAGEEFVSLHCDATKPSLSCEGLLCIPETECVHVLNPSTGQLWRFPSPSLLGPRLNRRFRKRTWSTYFPGCCAMGFGRDNVNGSYKVVRIFDYPDYCDILDVNTGEWKKLCKSRRYKVDVGRKSASVNGTIYWLRITRDGVDADRVYYTILALDLHTEKFHDVQRRGLPEGIMFEAQIVNLGDRLAIAMPQSSIVQDKHEWELKIWSMSAEEETWSKTHSISLASLGMNKSISFTPLTLSKEGNVVFYAHKKKRLFKYYQEADQLQSLSRDICVISPYVENLVTIHSKQVELRTRVTCLRSRKGWFESRVDDFFSKGKELGTWLWKNMIKVLATYLLAHLLCSYFCNSIGETLICAASLTLLCWLNHSGKGEPLAVGHIIMTIVVMKIFDIIIDDFVYSEVMR
ncbi:unnamed protein product [Microthlaspi erraticum]|uniref:F-box domain-containing protein n=1 Tax=Microthlaspi erraticum TaxID=1685480 RepID=A0A6D2JZH1_9BRAS|nr:unnamed protein product [Microthlaspi erraticum]